MKRFLILLLAVGMLLSCLGCSGEILHETQGTEQSSDTGTQNSAIPATLSADDPQWAEILAGPLTKDADYCAESSGYRMAETEDGYYLVIGRMLCYAEKPDIFTWYPVCYDPTCDHTDSLKCGASLPEVGFYLQDGRVYFLGSESHYVTYSTWKYALYSTDTDCANPREEYCFDYGEWANYNRAQVLVTPEYGYGKFGILNQDGTWTYRLLRLSASGTEIMGEATIDTEESVELLSSTGYYTSNGRFGFLCSILGGGDDAVYFPTEDGGMDVVIAGDDLHLEGACVLDDVIYHYEPGEGFYRSDLDGGNSVLITENHLAGGESYCMTERLYLETNLIFGEPLPENPTLCFYDGMEWYDLVLPKDIKKDEKTSVSALTVSSERLFLKTYDLPSREYRLYSIDLTQKPYTLELNTTMDDPYLFGS